MPADTAAAAGRIAKIVGGSASPIQPQEVRIMKKKGKKYLEAAKAVDRTVSYDKEEAVALAKKTAVAKFDETIEVHIRTGCDGRHAEQQVRGAVVLPHGTGKSVRVLV